MGWATFWADFSQIRLVTLVQRWSRPEKSGRELTLPVNRGMSRDIITRVARLF
jgi:hypothetical protein